ncbi:hypothetical protein RchiOBHm_Chr2g0105471 [Rosa chinensis]|uniref:Uncharacterized protein n=1 Tax=Rosa chinensis TaxID=74649 RepID=A0A2P6RNF6_ROSCH|nr:hypothetical protein RchiOBHm_Chr2g0105471 [Rosa chinensis]
MFWDSSTFSRGTDHSGFLHFPAFSIIIGGKLRDHWSCVGIGTRMNWNLVCSGCSA